jgi:hypothetical protein
MKLEIHYSVSDGGDGSAYPHFFESAELAELDQDFQRDVYDTGFAECCTGTIVIESDSPMKVIGDEIMTAEQFMAEIDREDENAAKFIPKVQALIDKKNQNGKKTR